MVQEATALSSWFNPKTEKRAGAIQGRGRLAREPIARGEAVVVKGGAILDRPTFERLRGEISPAEIQIDAARSPSWRCATSRRTKS